MAIIGINKITKNKGAIQARASSNPTYSRPDWIQLVKIDAVKKVRSISSAGDQMSQITTPQKIDTIRNGRKLSHSIFGCMVPTNARPSERIKSDKHVPLST